MGKYVLTVEAQRIISDLVRRGKDVEIRRKGDGYIILSVEKKIEYGAWRIGAGQGQ